MNVIQFLKSLTTRGLRLAEANEAGWYDFYINEDGNKQSVWVTTI